MKLSRSLLWTSERALITVISLREAPPSGAATAVLAGTTDGIGVALSSARRGRPRLKQPVPGDTYRVELRLPEQSASVLYASALTQNLTVSGVVDRLILAGLRPEAGDTSNP